MEMRPFGKLLPALTARARLLRAVTPVPRSELVPIEGAFGLVAAEEVRASRPVPSFARATWDGYAVRSRDTAPARPARPSEFRVVGEVFAERGSHRAVRRGEAIAIAPGGAVPRGADTVVIFESVEREGDRILLRRALRVGERISPPGDDFPRGARLVSAGEELTPVVLGAIASSGIRSIRVWVKPIVSVVPNGNELLRPGSRPRPGRIFESNNATLAAVILASGGIPRLYRPLPDDPAVIERTLREALTGSDMVLATGGSSVGERDYLPQVLPRLGSLLFHGIAVRPGKPTLAAQRGRKLVVGLPGHPTSCLVNMYWLGLPLLRRLAHRRGPGWTEGSALLGADALAPTPGLSTVVPLAFRNGRAYPAFRGSSVVMGMLGATGFALLPPGRRAVRAGAQVRVCYLNPPLGAPVFGNGPPTV